MSLEQGAKPSLVDKVSPVDLPALVPKIITEYDQAHLIPQEAKHFSMEITPSSYLQFLKPAGLVGQVRFMFQPQGFGSMRFWKKFI